jgi:O-succinylbenzoate synthase
VALASLPGFTLPGDISASRRYWEQDIVTPEFEVHDGHMAVPTGPGIGVELDMERIDALATRKVEFS